MNMKRKKAMRNNFVVFILTHGRPNKIYTIKTLKNCGYTGDIYYIVDNEDKTYDEYVKNYGDKVILFDKKKIADTTDEGDNFDDRRTITHARNICFEVAEKLGYEYFVQLDDDYTGFLWRFYVPNRKLILVRNMDRLFDNMIDFYKSDERILSLAMAQGGDFIGGKDNVMATGPKLKRKCMNSFICSVNRKFKFIGRMNEDVNTYVKLGSVGNLFFTFPLVSLSQKQTQTNSGGITEMYLDYGTYVKAFTTIMYNPSSVKVGLMGSVKPRIHHKIFWKYSTLLKK